MRTQYLAIPQRKLLARKAAAKASIPPEVRMLIEGNMEERMYHNLAGLDNTSAYLDFPGAKEACQECTKRTSAESRIVKYSSDAQEAERRTSNLKYNKQVEKMKKSGELDELMRFTAHQLSATGKWMEWQAGEEHDDMNSAK